MKEALGVVPELGQGGAHRVRDEVWRNQKTACSIPTPKFHLLREWSARTSRLDRRVIEKRKRPAVQVMHALESDDGEDGELQRILDRLDTARGELLRISVGQVGLVGNLQDGFA